MNIETKRKLNSLNMQDLAESIEAQESNPYFYAQLSFEERINSLIDDIYQKSIMREFKGVLSKLGLDILLRQ